MHDVFISYKSDEYDTANLVRNRLEQEGIGCWIAPDCIEGGQSYARQIPKAISECNVFVLLISRQSMDSIWVAREVDRAINEGKCVMPFLTEDAPLTDEFRFYLTNVQQYPAYHDFEGELNRMIADIRAYYQRKGLPQPVPRRIVPAQPAQVSVPSAAQTLLAETPQTVPAATENPSETAKQKNPPRRRLRTALLIAGGATLLIAAAIVCVSLLLHVRIAGKRHSVFDTYLSVSETELTEQDLKSIGRMKHLTNIEISDCTVSAEDLSALVHPKQYTLKLPNCGLNADQVASLRLDESTIISIDLSMNPIGAAKNIRFPERVDRLNIGYTGLDVSCLTGLTKLTDLNIDGNGVTSLRCLSEMNKLEKLSANENAIRTLDGLENCIYLREISVRDNKIESISGLRNATQLKKADFSKNRITDITPLGESAGTLENLCLSDNRIHLSETSELLTVWSFPNLTELYLDNNEITYLTFLSVMPKLKILSVNGNAGVVTMPPQTLALKTLYAANCGFAGDIGTFPGDPEAQYLRLDLSGAKFSRVGLGTTPYYFLNLADAELDEAGAQALSEANGVSVVFRYSELPDYAAMREHWTNIYIIDCPMNKRVNLEETIGKYKVHFIEKSQITGLFD